LLVLLGVSFKRTQPPPQPLPEEGGE